MEPRLSGNLAKTPKRILCTMSPDNTPSLGYLSGEELQDLALTINEAREQAVLDEEPQPEVTEEQIPQAIRLAKQYDVALLGATVGPHGVDRFAYSLVRLIQFEMGRLRCTAQEARESIAENLIRPLWGVHGENCPVWIDDELVRGAVDADDHKPMIILPPDFEQ